MSGVNLAEVLLDEMVILDCEPFKDKENMFDVMTAKLKKQDSCQTQRPTKMLWNTENP